MIATARPLYPSRLRRKIVRIERRLFAWRPGANPPPDRPAQAEEVLSALAARYQPGDRVASKDVCDLVGLSLATVALIRRWASHPQVDRWPYRHALAGFAAVEARRRSRAEGGDS